MGLDSVKTHIMSEGVIRNYFDECVTLYRYFFKHSRIDNRQSLGITASISNDASRNKRVLFSPEDQYYNSNEWYVPCKSDKDKFLKHAAV